MKERMKAVGVFVDRHKLSAAAVVAVVGIMVAPAASWATAYDPTSDLTNLATNTGTQLGPIVVAVVTALIGIVILFWGVKFVLNLITRGGRAGR